MADIKLYIHYITRTFSSFISILKSPRSIELSRKIQDEESIIEFAIYAALISALVNTIYISASEDSGIDLIKLMKLVVYSFVAFMFQALIFLIVSRAFRKKTSFLVFFKIIALASTYSVPMAVFASPYIETDFYKTMELAAKYGPSFIIDYRYIPSVPLSTSIACIAGYVLCLFAQLYFIFHQVKLAINSTYIVTFLITFIAAILIYIMNFYVFGQIAAFALIS